jgi:hypothetical protein
MFNVLHRSQPQLSTAADTSGHRLRLPLWNDTLLDTFGALKRESAVPAIENGGLYFRTWGIRTTRPPSVIDQVETPLGTHSILKTSQNR